MLGGTAIPFHVDRFGSVHIAPSTSVVGGSSYLFPRPNTSIPICRNGPRYVNIGSTSYIPSYAPSSMTHVPSNVFLMSHPPHSSHGPLNQITTSSHVVPSSTHTFVSQGYMPPYMSTSYVPHHVLPYVSEDQSAYQSYNYGLVAPQSQGIPKYNIPMYHFMGQAGGSYYPTRQGHGDYNNHPYIN